MSDINIVIMAGGSGTRFWPLGREKKPKQCLRIFSDKTMIEETVERLKLLSPSIAIVTNQQLADHMRIPLPNVKYIIEPAAKNTAPCIGLAAIHCDPESIIVIETADHVYKDPDAYIKNLKKAIEWADKDYIVQIGIKPLYPETGYGYIQQDMLLDDSDVKVYKIKSFREKPNIETAEKYIESGDYLWNAGIFVFRVGVMLGEMQKFMPNLYSGLMRIRESNFDPAVVSDVFSQLPKEETTSIDYGIAEKTDKGAVVRGEFPWDDIGDLKSFERFCEPDAAGNVVKTKHYVGIDSKGNVILNDDPDKLVSTIGLNDCVIVNTADCVFVCPKTKVQDVKKMVERLKSRGLDKYL